MWQYLWVERCPYVRYSPDSLDGNDVIRRIPFDRPGAANFQQPLHYGSLPRSFNRIPPCYHVHSPREATTKTRFRYISHCTNLPELGHIRRKSRLRSATAKMKKLIALEKPATAEEQKLQSRMA